MKLNIGCGKDIRKGYVNMDILKLQGVNIVHDLNKIPYPFKSNTFEEIVCQDVLEHVGDLLEIMKELHRILKPNGIIKIRVPHFTSAIAFTDPTHTKFYGTDSFNYFLKDTPYHFYVDYSFELVNRKLEFGKSLAIWNWIIEPIANKFPRFYEDTPLRIFPAMNLHFALKKIENKKLGQKRKNE